MPRRDSMKEPRRQASQLLITFLILLPTISCGKKMAAPPSPIDGYAGIVANDKDRLQESLFKGDQAVLSNQDIERILGARLLLDDRRRLAVLRLNSRITWSEELADLETQNSERFLQALRSAKRLTQVR